MRESGPRKRDEDGDVDEDDHRGDEVLSLVLPPPWPPPWMGRGSPSGPWTSLR